jgi:hypothetical protein
VHKPTEFRRPRDEGRLRGVIDRRRYPLPQVHYDRTAAAVQRQSAVAGLQAGLAAADDIEVPSRTRLAAAVLMTRHRFRRIENT